MRWKKGCSCINFENGIDAWSRKTRDPTSLFGCEAAVVPSDLEDVVPSDKGTRASGERSTTPGLPPAHPDPKTWCPATKEQGIAGREAPRPARRRRLRLERRGACRRRNKGLQGAKHHVWPADGAMGPEDVVPGDERTRACGEGSTTPGRRSAHPARKTWCSATKEQGLVGREAPRPPDRSPPRRSPGPQPKALHMPEALSFRRSPTN